jgi:hypothetical protein
MCKFSPIPLKKIAEIKDADRLNPSETTSNVVTLQKNPSIGGGGWTLNRMAHSVLPLT